MDKQLSDHLSILYFIITQSIIPILSKSPPEIPTSGEDISPD